MKSFVLSATVSTDNPAAISQILKRLIGKTGSVKKASSDSAQHKGQGEFVVKAVMQGNNSKELNRKILSALRKAEKKTRLRSEWTSGGTTERYFDYVLKKTTQKK
jgi:hypothetical protein